MIRLYIEGEILDVRERIDTSRAGRTVKNYTLVYKKSAIT
jgi:hypothetical protein